MLNASRLELPQPPSLRRGFHNARNLRTGATGRSIGCVGVGFYGPLGPAVHFGVSFDLADTLARYAALTVRVGLNVRAGQPVFISSPIEAAPFTRLAAAEAYRAGASLVDVAWFDDEVALARYRLAAKDSFSEYPVWFAQGRRAAGEAGAAFLSISGENPDLLAGQDPDSIAAATRASRTHNHALQELLSSNRSNWSVVAFPTRAWAAKVTGRNDDAGLESLWMHIISATRLDAPDPVSAWEEHLRALEARRDEINARRFRSLRFTGPGTNLHVRLPDAHLWRGGRAVTTGGQVFAPNLPTEEIFTLPSRDGVDGTVRATKPLSYAGTLIEDITLTFKDGECVQANATRNEDALIRLLDTDAGARRLGEVALVSNSGAVARTNTLFFNTLYDENAACHLALGNAYPFTVEGGADMSKDAFAAAGGNTSMTHVDFMIGDATVNVDGLTADGDSIPILREGEFVALG